MSAALDLALAAIILLLFAAVLLLAFAAHMTTSLVRSLSTVEEEIADFMGFPVASDAPDMIAMLGSAYAPDRLRPQGESIVEGALASRQMTSHELADALAARDPLVDARGV